MAECLGSPLRPPVTVPVSAAFVLADLHFVAVVPIIRMDDHARG
jgi:hypothetical protein